MRKVVISCPACSMSGYGERSRDIIKSLMTYDDCDVKIMNQRWGGTPNTAKIPESWKSKFITRMEEKPDIWIQITVPNEFQAIGDFNIGITAGIETDRCSPEFIEGVNRMDTVLVSSNHAKEVFLRTNYQKNDDKGNAVSHLKCTKPINVLFEGLDINQYFKTKDLDRNVDRMLKEMPEDKMFLFVGHWLQGDFGQDRKDVGGLVKSFFEAFKNKSAKNQPALVLKTSYGASHSITSVNEMRRRIGEIADSIGARTLPNIYILSGELSTSEMNSLYNHPKIKAMVSLTKGEGFGRPLLEFSITGKPVLASNWSGHVDFLGEHGIMIPGGLGPVHKSVVWKGFIEEGSNWFTANYGYAASMMKAVDKDYKGYLAKTRKQTQYVKDNFTMEKMAEKLYKHLDPKYINRELTIEEATQVI